MNPDGWHTTSFKRNFMQMRLRVALFCVLDLISENRTG